MIRLRTGTHPGLVRDKLGECARDARNVLGAGGAFDDLVQAYFAWAAQSQRLLGPLITDEALGSLILTRRYWALFGGTVAQRPVIVQAIGSELETRATALEVAASEIEHMLIWWRGGQTVIVGLDTNVVLDLHDRLSDIDWAASLGSQTDLPIGLVIPQRVVEELDGLKNRGSTDVRNHARLALKTIESQLQDVGPNATLFAGDTGRPHIYLRVLGDNLDHEPLPVADAEIIDRLLTLSTFAERVALATFDTAMLFRARSAGLTAFRPPRS